MSRYTICHNDDDPKNPNHHRVLIEACEVDGAFGVFVDGEECDMVPRQATEAAAEQYINALWGSPYWDLRIVRDDRHNLDGI